MQLEYFVSFSGPVNKLGTLGPQVFKEGREDLFTLYQSGVPSFIP